MSPYTLSIWIWEGHFHHFELFIMVSCTRNNNLNSREVSWELNGEQKAWLRSEREKRGINLVVGKLKGSLRNDKEIEWRQKTSGNGWEKKVVKDGLQKDVREGECRGLEKMVLEGEKTARWLNPPKTITALVSK